MKLGTYFVILCMIPPAAAAEYGVTPAQSWQRSTNSLFRLEISGRGLSSSDTIRLIEPGRSCTDDSGDVKSLDSTLQWNCPDIGSGCTSIRVSPPIDIPVQTIQWDCLTMSPKNECSGLNSIKSIASDPAGIFRLKFSFSTPVKMGQFIRLGSGVQCGSNCDSSILNILRGGIADATSDKFKIGNEVFIDSDDPADTIQLRIPALASVNPPLFTIDPNVGYIEWYRTDEIFTRVELNGLLQRSQINVCWNGGGRPGGYTSSAGLLEIVDAGVIGTVSISPVSESYDAPSIPTILSFTTSSSETYISPRFEMELLLRIMNPSELAVINIDGSSLSQSSATSQLTCSNIFSELWSSDGGFPYPKGCYVNVWSVNGKTIGCDIRMRFERGNGLNPSTQYQLVFNVRIDPTNIRAGSPCCATKTCGLSTDSIQVRGCQYITIATIADAEDAPYQFIEVGRPLLRTAPFSSFSRGVGNPYVSSAVIEGGFNGLLNIGNTDSIIVSLFGGDGANTGPIRAGYTVRFILTPLTEWSLSPSCSAEIVHLETDVSYTGPAASCSSEAIVTGGHRNVVRVELPVNLPNYSGVSSRLSVRISGLSVPSTGIFANSVLIELLDENNAHAHLASTDPNIAQIWKDSDVASVGRIVAETDLVELSFASDPAGHVFHLNLIPRVTIPVGGEVEIQLPTGWTCQSVFAPTGEENFWSSVLDSPHPSGRGLISAWSACKLTAETTIYSSTSIFVGIVVNFSPTPMSSHDSAFRLSIRSGLLSLPPVRFQSFESEAFVSSVAVLGELTETHVEPVSSWLPSSTGIVAVFFRTEQAVISGGFIRIKIPTDFAIPSSGCVSYDLAEYVYATAESAIVSRVPGRNDACLMKGENTVNIPFSGTLESGRKYAFGLTVRFPPVVDKLDYLWSMWTMDSRGSLIDGIANMHSFGLYAAQAQLNAELSDWRPFSVSNEPALLTLSWTGIEMDQPVNVRVSLPIGFEFATSSVPSTLIGDVDWSLKFSNSVGRFAYFASVLLSDKTQYAVQFSVHVPDRPPSESLSRFTIEFGYDSSSYRVQVADSTGSSSLPVLGINNAKLVPLNTIADMETWLHIEFELHAQLGADWVAITLPDGLSISQCAVLVENPTDLAHGLSCTFIDQKIIFSGSGSSISAGKYSLNVRARNPISPVSLTVDQTRPCGFNMCITFESSAELSPLSLVGYPILSQMHAGGFVTKIGYSRTRFAGRDDRPGARRNFFVLFFQPLVGGSEIEIQAPFGFQFDPNCLIFSVSANQVFGDGIPWPPEYQIWPRGVEMVSCVGSEYIAKIVLSNPLPVASKPYAIRVGVAGNPSSVSAIFYQWTVLIPDIESTDVFNTFALWTFEASLTAAARGAGSVDILSFSLKPFNRVEVGGSLEISLPAGFVIHGQVCAKSSLLRSGSGGTVKLSACTVPSPATLFVILGELMESGNLYLIELLVTNPPSATSTSVRVQSYDKSSHPLDESRLDVPSLVPAPSKFSVSGVQTEGLMTVPNLSFSISFQFDLLVDDRIVISAPSGALLFNGASELVHVLAEPVTAGTEINVMSSTKNPASTPPTLNVFVASLYRGSAVMLSQGALRGWDIIPQLSDISFETTGPLRSAKSLSSISLSFISVNDFDTIALSFISSLFDLSVVSSATVTVTDIRDVTFAVPVAVLSSNTPKSLTVRFGKVVAGGSQAVLDLSGVRIGSLPGPAWANVQVLLGGSLVGSRVRVLAMTIPGLLAVSSRSITTDSTQELKYLFPSVSLPPRTGEMAVITLKVQTDLEIPEGSEIRIVNTPYQVDQTIPVEDASGEIEISFQAPIPEDVGSAESKFSIKILDSAGVLIHTNDALTDGFSAVYPLDATLRTVRSPPSAMIEVEVSIVSTGPAASIRFLSVTAPEGFVFEPDCGSGSLSSCQGGGPSALLSVSDGSPLPSLVSFKVTTPGTTPAENAWLLVGQDLDRNILSWEIVVNAFTVRSMANVWIEFARLAGVTTPVGIAFSTQERVRKVAYLRIQYPEGYILDCSSISRGTLPIYAETSWTEFCQLDKNVISITFLQDLVPGTYSFTIEALMPSDTVLDSSFAITLLDSSDTVIDGILEYPCHTVRPATDPLFINVGVPTRTYEALKWYPAIVTGSSILGVEMSFVINQQISIGLDGKNPVSHILVILPSGFVHRIELESDVSETGGDSSIVSSIDMSRPDRLIIALDTSGSFAEGSYGFRFPVWVPAQTPRVNVWTLSFCAGTCIDRIDNTVIATFPYTGFGIGQTNPLTLEQSKDSALLGGWILLLIFLMVI